MKALRHPLSRTAPVDRRAAAWAAATLFLLLAAYYVLRPLRDEMAVRVGTSRLGLLFTATFIGMLCAAPVFGWCAARIRPSRLVPGVSGLFARQLALFNVAMQDTGFGTTGSAVFFAWISIFNVFAVSVFRSLLTDRFGLDAAERLFGPISVGGSLGAIVGPSLTALLAEPLGVARLPLVSMALPDTVVVRGADAASGWLVEGARAMSIVGAPLALVAVPVALLGAVTGWRLARHPTIPVQEEEHHDPQEPADRPAPGPGTALVDGRHGPAAARRHD